MERVVKLPQLKFGIPCDIVEHFFLHDELHFDSSIIGITEMTTIRLLYIYNI